MSVLSESNVDLSGLPYEVGGPGRHAHGNVGAEQEDQVCMANARHGAQILPLHKRPRRAGKSSPGVVDVERSEPMLAHWADAAEPWPIAAACMPRGDEGKRQRRVDIGGIGGHSRLPIRRLAAVCRRL